MMPMTLSSGERDAAGQDSAPLRGCLVHGSESPFEFALAPRFNQVPLDSLVDPPPMVLNQDGLSTAPKQNLNLFVRIGSCWWHFVSPIWAGTCQSGKTHSVHIQFLKAQLCPYFARWNGP